MIGGGFSNCQIEQTWSILVADFEYISEAAVVTRAVRAPRRVIKRVGATRRPQTDSHRRNRLVQLEAHQVANRQQRRIFVRPQFVGSAPVRGMHMPTAGRASDVPVYRSNSVRQRLERSAVRSSAHQGQS